MIQTNHFLLSQLTADSASGGPLHAATVGLYVNNINILPTTELTDLTEASFPGYARSSAITWGSPYMAAGGTVQMVDGVVAFSGTGTFTTSQTAYGYFLCDSGGLLIGGDRFTTAITFAAPGDTLNVALVWPSGADVL
jgi:hypothetical protein